ncbi:ketoacyl-ACP synthase III [Elizabethkingia anophelis]|uniref:Ketoacyl-ACP synthase III n=1 Tax=Elizabethkingia anophelis R26 TaxID=1246994 RepID=A0ABM6MSJ5_9FLAO|nr:ketoacyl-ACP synthase III [Elizabethkingia anophelis]ATC36120.1 ketoacyl-ACP synthase III [Elizabethkingia anophelis R26]ATC39797.1 ketoacyl-ACP synthase III [Elizabethkingia anophelis Ag1]ATC43476.1 ketoacyl-ACP synthase III [Elizabethkingia anophelis]ATC47152.1 ketoacyl-ACP synthase III [Elizabethkingia anophelis]ELR80715.1 beta-ketoacyl-acyl-carrier-protein synthase I [Elizabethkingia anophelis R26]
MALFSIENVRIAGVVSAVPSNIVNNLENDLFSNREEAEKFISVTGIAEKRHVDIGVCTSDLCVKAANDLLNKLDWKKEDIQVLIMVTQTPDYVVPNTSIIVQDKLGLSKDTICFDVPLGCSGYVYGLSILAQFLQTGQIKKGLLLVGDTLSRQCSPLDKTTYPLFGDAGSATALEFCLGEKMDFNLWSDGSGYNDIIVPDGGYRQPFSEESLLLKEDADGNKRAGINTYMNGTNVFSFGIGTVTQEIKKFIEHFSIDKESIKHFYFHQANRFMNDMIRKKLKLTTEQVPYSLDRFGNTSSATIPLTISTQDENFDDTEVIMCGFGVGLSIGIVRVKMNKNCVKELIEY